MNQQELLSEFDSFAEKARAIIEKKNKDYAQSDALSNFKLSAAVSGISTESGCLNQIAIKISRLGVLIHKSTVENEPIDDTVLDLFNYAFLLHAIMEDKT